MSMMAVILVFAAPALVSVIDDSYSYEGSLETQLLDIPDTGDASILLVEGENPDISYIPASENDGTFVIALNDSSLVSDVKCARFNGIDMAPIISGTGAVKVVTPSDVTKVNVVLHGLSGGVVLTLDQSESDPSVWTGSFSSVDLVKLRSEEYYTMWVDLFGPNEYFEMEVFAVGEYVIPYGEIIIGGAGVLLMVCALLATPWFGLSGYTGRRITRRR